MTNDNDKDKNMYCWDISVQDDIVSFDLAVKEKNIEKRFKINNVIKIKGELTLQGSFSIKISKSTLLFLISKLIVSIIDERKADTEYVKCKIFDSDAHKLVSDNDTSSLSFEVVRTNNGQYNLCIRLESILECKALDSTLGRMLDLSTENKSFISYYSIDISVSKIQELLRKIESDSKVQLDISVVFSDKNDVWDDLANILVQAE